MRPLRVNNPDFQIEPFFLSFLVRLKTGRYLSHRKSGKAVLIRMVFDEQLTFKKKVCMQYLGIDVAKRKLDCVLLDNNNQRKISVENNLEGFLSLQKRLKTKDVHICLEATGTYGEACSHFFHEAGFLVSVVNPARIKGFSRSLGLRSKTDTQDALCIARFCKACQPPAWKPLPDAHNQLRKLYRASLALQQDIQRFTNRLKEQTNPMIIRSYQKAQSALEQELEQIEAEMKQVITHDTELKEKFQLLMSIKGIGNKTAVAVLAELPDMSQFNNARQLAAFAGVTPTHKQSGTSLNKPAHLSKSGAQTLRKALFFPAMVAGRYNPILSDFKQRLQERGKAKMSILGALMRKLLHIIYGVLKHKIPFDPNFQLT